MPTVSINDTELFYVEVGKGLPCLVMHGGLGLDHSYLHPWLDPLGDSLRLIYYDHRGNGRSGRPPRETLTFEQFCDDADALRAHLGHERVAILAHSMGSWIALEYALRYPERLSHLMLVGASSSFDYYPEIEANMRRKGATEAMWATWNSPIPDDAAYRHWLGVIGPLYWHRYNPDLARRVTEHIVCSADALHRSLELAASWNVTADLGKTRAPTLLLVGQNDFIMPPAKAAILHASIPSSELVLLESSGHFPFIEEPETFFETIRTWLARTDAVLPLPGVQMLGAPR